MGNFKFEISDLKEHSQRDGKVAQRRDRVASKSLGEGRSRNNYRCFARRVNAARTAVF
jgi:hypothetical protein